MTKKKDRNQELEQHARGRLKSHFSEWVVNSLDGEDYAFDFEIRPTEQIGGSGEVTPSPFFAQLKASRRFDDPDSVWWDFDTSYLLDDCLQATVPVVLLIYERHADEFYWYVAQNYCWDVLDEERTGWRDQSTVRTRIDRDPLTDSNAKYTLLNGIERAQRRISTRASIASSRRPTLDHPPDTSLASSEQVVAHKKELVDDALSLADSDMIDRAMRKLMQVYLMPEKDEPTLEAIKYLIELRETDDISIAFAKSRLANEGAELAEKYSRTPLLDQFQEELDSAWSDIEETFIGARYHHKRAKQDVQILDVEGWDDTDDSTTVLVALVQFGVGELGDESARGIAESDEFELIETGESRSPRRDACAERNHSFDTDDLRELPDFAICSDCGLSRETIQNWLKHDVPEICDNCNSVVYDTICERGCVLCTDCK